MEDPVDGSLLESHKENIVPSREGRSAQAISQLYSVPRAQRARELAATHARYREILDGIPKDAPLLPPSSSSSDNEDSDGDDALSPEARDPLLFYCQYVQWIMDNYPSGSSSESGLLNILEEATRSFCGKDVYKNDERYVKLWIEYANLVEGSERVFAFMLANDIGSEFAWPYEEFATVLERNKNFKKADGVYRLAIARKVQGQETLKAKYKDFQARRAASVASSSSSAATSDEPPPASVAPVISTVPTAQPASIPARAPLGARTALGGLGSRNPSGNALSSNTRVPSLTASSSSTPQPRQGLVLGGASSSRSIANVSSVSSARLNSVSNAGKVSVFVDTPPPADVSLLQENAAPDIQTGEWKKLGTRAEIVKENKTSGGTAGETGGIHQNKVVTKGGPKIEIFRDETAGVTPSPSNSNPDIAADQVFRQREASARRAAESLSRNPLQNFSRQFARNIDIPGV